MPRRDISENSGKINASTLKRILPFFEGQRKIMVFAVLAVLFATGAITSLPLVFREMVDKAIPSKDPDLIIIIGLSYLGLLVFHGTVEYLQNLIVGYMGIDIVNNIKLKMFKHIITLSVKFFDKNGTGSLISRIESDSQKLFMLFSTVGLQMLGAFLTISISMFVMLLTNVKLTLIVLSIVPVYMIGTFIIFKKMRPMFRYDRELYAKISSFLGEHLKAIPLLRNLNNINWSKKKFFKTNETKWRYEFKIFLLEQIIWFFLMLVPQLIIAVILYKSVSWIGMGVITIGTVWMFIQYIQAALHPLIMLSEQLSEVQRAFGSADRIFEILDKERDIVEGDIKSKDFSFEKEISFDNVSFHYEKEKPVLKNVSFSIKKGTTVAIVGPTGSGKTTIISLLARFYDPIEGSVQIDGTDIKDLTFSALRDRINLVLQDIYLFPGNITDNLRVLRKDISKDAVQDAAKIMGIYDYISSLPDGFETELKEEGTNISFGERQLLSFSRALTFKPEILMMDEATSSIDPYTEEKIQQSMQKLLKGRTSIIIAHRLSTITHADNILVIDKGEIAEQGKHDELVKIKNGIYADLYRAQSESENGKNNNGGGLKDA